MASPNTVGQTKHNLRNSSDGLRIALPSPAPSGRQVHSEISAFEGLRMARTPPTESSFGRNQRPYDVFINPPTRSVQQVHSKISVFSKISALEGLTMALTPPAESFGKNHRPYDVFINHYGQDTKHTVANNIYDKLDATGLRFFLDKNKLKLEDFFPHALQEAIASSSLHIVIFSANYAKSPWYLTELTFMLLSGITFIPIFYYVEPYTLRWVTQGIYADALNTYETKNKYSTQRLESWRLALHKASFYTHQIIDNQCNSI